MSIGFLIAVIGCLIGLNSWMRKRDDDNKSNTEKDTAARIETRLMLENINKCVTDIKQDIKTNNKQIQNIQEKQIIQSQEIKALWKKSDEYAAIVNDLQNKVNDLDK